MSAREPTENARRLSVPVTHTTKGHKEAKRDVLEEPHRDRPIAEPVHRLAQTICHFCEIVGS